MSSESTGARPSLSLFGIPVFALSPIVLPVLVVVAASVVRLALRLDEVVVDPRLLNAIAKLDPTLEAVAQDYAARSQWAAALLVWMSLMFGGCFFSLATTHRTWKALGRPPVLMNALVGGAALLVAVAISRIGNDAVAVLGPGIQSQLFVVVERWTGMPIARIVATAVGAATSVTARE